MPAGGPGWSGPVRRRPAARPGPVRRASPDGAGPAGPAGWYFVLSFVYFLYMFWYMLNLSPLNDVYVEGSFIIFFKNGHLA